MLKMATEKQNQEEMRKHFIQALYGTLDGVVSPTPYLQIMEGDNVDVRFLNGKGKLPMPQTIEINDMDFDIASLFYDDIHILWEGHTGVGKSYRAKAIGETVFGKEGYVELHLESGVYASSPTDPFVATIMQNGVPKTIIDNEKSSKYGLIIFEELNTGNFNDVRTISEGYVNINGSIGLLRIPIRNTGRYKNIAILATMNPSDEMHTHARELTIAGENRFLKLKAANGVTEAGSSQLEKKLGLDVHDRFWSEFSKRTGIKGGWKEIYPIVTDPEQFPTELDGETREFIDTSLGYVGYDPKETFQRNVELMQQGGLSPHFSIRDDNNYRKILETQGKLKHGFVRRDLRKIRDLSRLLGFIKGIKDCSYNATVGLNDVAAGIGVILESKTITGTDYGSLMALVNDARSTYAEMHKQMNIPESFGIRQAVWQAAIQSDQEHGFGAYINTLRAGIAQLNIDATNIAQATIKSRVLADLVVLEHFSKAYETDVTAVLKAKGTGTFAGFSELYQDNKGKSSIYEHRLGSIMG